MSEAYLRFRDVGEALLLVGPGLRLGGRALLALQLVGRGVGGGEVIVALLDRGVVLRAVLRLLGLGERGGRAQGERQGESHGRLGKNVLHQVTPLKSWVGFRSAVSSFAPKKVGKGRAIDRAGARAGSTARFHWQFRRDGARVASRRGPETVAFLSAQAF